MSLFRSRKSAAVQPDFSGLAIQTSTAAAPIPVVYGTTRCAPNVIWSAGASATPQYSGGGGKGGGGGATVSGYEYYEWVMFAIGEGPVVAVQTIYNGQGTYPYGSLGLSLVPGATPQTPWAPAAAAYPAYALPYNGTAYMASSDFDLGSSASVPAIAFEVAGRLAGTAPSVNGCDVDPAAVVADFLGSPQYGVGFPAGSLDAATLTGTPGDGSYASYCKAAGLAFSPALTDPETASSILTRWLLLTNTAAIWSGGRLKFVPYGDAAIAGAQPRSICLTIAASLTLQAAPAPLFAGDRGVTYAAGGALAMVAAAPAGGLAKGNYAVAGGTYAFSALDLGASVVVAFAAQPAASFAPDTQPVYDLSDDDFLAADGADPLEVSRSDPKAAANVLRLECLDRSNSYAATPVEARDQNAIEQFGLNIGSTITAHEICDLAIGVGAAQLILQRGLYVRNTYAFRLSWECCLLEPMDLVTLTDPGLGMDRALARITAIAEDADGLLAVTAEEFTGGTATAAAYPVAANAAPAVNRNAAPAPVNPPVVFEPPSGLTDGGAQVWAAVSGGANGVADPNWGGAVVWISRDGTSYAQGGRVTAPARQGVLAAALPAWAAGGSDSVDTLSVDLGMSGGVLASASPLDAANAVTLALVEGELLAYAAATLTGPNRYALTGLRRGLYGSAARAHPAGACFARLDGAVFKTAVPAGAIGTPLYLKFQSFNIFGGGTQDLSTCAAVSFTPIGSGLFGPTAAEISTGTSFDEGLASQPATQVDDYGLASDPYASPLDDGLASDLPVALALASGGTGAVTPATARANMAAAASGVNGDITSLGALTRISAGPQQAVTIDPASGHVGLAGYTADANNALGVLGTAALFSASTDSFRFTFSKTTPGADAVLSFQTAFSARALMGTAGTDDFQLKVSPDGSTYYQAFVTDRTTGNTAFKALLGPAGYAVAALPAGAFNGALAFAANGRKAGEAAGAGTGVVVAYSNGAWRRLGDDAVVAS